jgi:hypothetical protein
MSEIEHTENNLEINKEGKYRDEIFQLLKNTLSETESEEYLIIKELFLSEPMDNNQLLERIIKSQ